MVRKYFGTDGIRGPANVFPLTADFAVRLGRAAAEHYGGNQSKKQQLTHVTSLPISTTKAERISLSRTWHNIPALLGTW